MASAPEVVECVWSWTLTFPYYLPRWVSTRDPKNGGSTSQNDGEVQCAQGLVEFWSTMNGGGGQKKGRT